MRKINAFIATLAVCAVTPSMQSCLNDGDSDDLRRPTALVTVCPADDGSFTMNLDNSTVLVPTNLKTSPFGKKEVRALVNYTDDPKGRATTQNVYVNWIDSIRTKMPEPTLGEENDKIYGNDPVEIVRDWVTIAEDGYLTMRVRTVWGQSGTPHVLSLLTGTNPDNPYELELRHNAKGDLYGDFGDALIAFNLNGLPRNDNDEPTITLKWKSFSGEKELEFDIKLRPEAPASALLAPLPFRAIE